MGKVQIVIFSKWRALFYFSPIAFSIWMLGNVLVSKPLALGTEPGLIFGRCLLLEFSFTKDFCLTITYLKFCSIIQLEEASIVLIEVTQDLGIKIGCCREVSILHFWNAKPRVPEQAEKHCEIFLILTLNRGLLPVYKSNRYQRLQEGLTRKD